MTSWERARYIPWDRIPLPDTRPRAPGEDPPVGLDTARERIFQQLRRESVNSGIPFQTKQEEAAEEGVNDHGVASSTTEMKSTIVPYSTPDFLKQAAFGACIGTITGGVFGFMDGMRTVGESNVLKNASNVAKGKYLMQGTTRSATLFGAYFSGFHCLKYGLRVTLDPGEFAEIFMAAPVALGALAIQPSTRQALPYATMLVGMDAVNLYMKKMD